MSGQPPPSGLDVRGYMLDISRDRVPTRESLDQLVGILGALDYTELQLYTEHTYAWPEHEVVWRDASPMTADDLAWLRVRCEQDGLDLVPCLNGFGHMERFLRHDAYRHRAELAAADPAVAGRGPIGPTTLAPTEENAAFALDLFRGVLDACPSTTIHIGGDEPFELGEGWSAPLVRERGRTAVYLEHLRRLIDPLVADGHEVLFWGDILRDRADLLAALPAAATPVVWHYEAPLGPDAPSLRAVLGADLVDRLGLPDDGLVGFAAHTRAFAAAGCRYRLAPGTSTWNSFIGRWDDARANIDDAVTTAIAEGAVGVVLTDWGDNGHHQPPAVSLPPLVHFGLAARTGTPPSEAEVEAAIDDLTERPGLGARLTALGHVHRRLGVRSFNASPLWEAVVRRPPRDAGDLAGDDALAEVLDLLDTTVDRWDDRDPVDAGLAAAAGLAAVGARRLAVAAGRDRFAERDLDADLADARDRHAAAWGLTSRPGGLEDSLRRLDRRR